MILYKRYNWQLCFFFINFIFTDDTSLYIVVNNPQFVALHINTYLKPTYSWASKWLVDFNPLKLLFWRIL